MALINQNSIIGVTSITSPSASNVLTVHTNDTTERLRVTADGVSFSGTNASLDTSGNLTIAGVLTYEDVTSVDSVGIITAQSGIHVTGGSVGIGTNNPDASLHIHRDDITSFDAIWMSGSTKRKNVIKVNNSDNLIIGVDENDEGNDSNFRLQIDGSEKLRITSNGSVGVGTATPGDGTLVDIAQEFGRTRISKYGHIISLNCLSPAMKFLCLIHSASIISSISLFVYSLAI
jgi:hypothetical protein